VDDCGESYIGRDTPKSADPGGRSYLDETRRSSIPERRTSGNRRSYAETPIVTSSPLENDDRWDTSGTTPISSMDRTRIDRTNPRHVTFSTPAELEWDPGPEPTPRVAERAPVGRPRGRGQTRERKPVPAPKQYPTRERKPTSRYGFSYVHGLDSAVD